MSILTNLFCDYNVFSTIESIVFWRQGIILLYLNTSCTKRKIYIDAEYDDDGKGGDCWWCADDDVDDVRAIFVLFWFVAKFAVERSLVNCPTHCSADCWAGSAPYSGLVWMFERIFILQNATPYNSHLQVTHTKPSL